MERESAQQLAVIQEVRSAREARLLALPNVVGVGIGYKEKDLHGTGELAVIVYVESKKPGTELTRREFVPRTLAPPRAAAAVPTATEPPDTAEVTLPGRPARVPTDVKEAGRLEAHTFGERLRPARPGYSLGHFQVTAGTFGCLVRDLAPPHQVHILSNNHVLANLNEANLGDPILQPGPFDDGAFPEDTLATLSRFVPISFGSPKDYNLVDAALATTQEPRLAIGAIAGLGLPLGTAEAQLGMAVMKSGRTTQTTTGEVIDIDATVGVNFGARVAYFRNQVITTNMAAGGDSGSLLLDQEGLRAVGLLFAGSPLVTIHNRVHNVLMALGVELLTA